MSIFKQGDNSCYFIHIPRTAGRYVTSLFETTKNKKILCSHHQLGVEQYVGIDVIHLHYPLYENYLNVKDIPHITIVRNPIDRFESCVRYMHYFHNIEYDELLQFKDTFDYFIKSEREIHSFHNNWFTPQHKFISPKTFIWKYENGFGKNFIKWVYEKTNIQIDSNNLEYQKLPKENNKKYELCDVVKKYVKDLYQKDCELFCY